jgi:fructose-1,6-bisphosphatase/inositol monophosphatase family enzyme
MSGREINPEKLETALIDAGIAMIRDVQNDIATLLRFDKRSALETVQIKWKDRSNITTYLDISSEMRARAFLFEKLEAKLGSHFRPPIIVGEESLRDPELELSGFGVAILLDIVDGTDLLAKDLSNWCSAAVFIDTDAGRILGALVGDAFGRIYMARSRRPGAWLYPPDEPVPQEIFPVAKKRVADAYVCFYGQKADRLLEVAQHAKFLPQIKRVYNLAGNPMLVKVADGSMDAVFEMRGQAPHDVVAGAFIAQRAGATALLLDGTRLDCAEALRYPARTRLRYVVAATSGLARRLIALIGES